LPTLSSYSNLSYCTGSKLVERDARNLNPGSCSFGKFWIH
jgi:hypothetical protein